MPQTTELNTRLTGRLLPPREALINPNFGDNEIAKGKVADQLKRRGKYDMHFLGKKMVHVVSPQIRS